MTFKPIVDKFVDIDGFRAHVEGLQFGAWRPDFVVVHNTSSPTLANYAEWRAHPNRHGNWSPEQWGRNLASYYAGLGWSTGPHAFVCPDGVLLFTPFTMPGTHSPSWNGRTLGIETVGEFETEPFDNGVRDNLIAALGILHAQLGLNSADYHFGVRGLHFHKEDPRTTHKSCPGRHMVKTDLVNAVVDYIATAHAGEHHVPPDHPPQPPDAIGITLTGRMSVFGGPDDRGVSPSEGLALVEPGDMAKFPGIFLSSQPPGTSGLARRLDPSAHYIACRWDYSRTPRSFLQGVTVKVSANGKTFDARPVDWGPNARTGRIADLSPGLARALGLDTDDIVQVVIPRVSA